MGIPESFRENSNTYADKLSNVYETLYNSNHLNTLCGSLWSTFQTLGNAGAGRVIY